MATIRDVARESGVSVATVSYVLNNGPRPVAASTRERVLHVMQRLNYHPNAMARGLVRRQMHTIGVLFGDMEKVIFTNPYAATVLQGVVASAADARYNITLFTTRWENAAQSAPAFRDRRTDGVIVVAPLLASDVVPGLAALGIPLIVVSAESGMPEVPYVDVDNVHGARLAAEHLISLGHTRIAHLSGEGDHASVIARRASFADTLAAAGIPIRPEYFPDGSYVPERAEVIARNLLTLPERPTAIFTSNDILALMVIEIARELGIRVPEDLSLVGFDDLPSAAVSVPPLTTVRQPLIEIGVLATRLMLRQIEEATNSLRTRSVSSSARTRTPAASSLAHIIEPELIVRGSTAGVRASQ